VFFAATVAVTAGPVAMVLPDPASLRPAPALIALGAGWLLLSRRWNLVAVLALSALAGGAAAALG
jgi:chromate transporter